MGVSLVLLALLLAWVDFDRLFGRLARIDAGTFGTAALVFFSAAIGFNSLRWWLLLRRGGTQVRLVRLAAVNSVGIFFSMFLPTTMGGDVMRIYELERTSVPRENALATILLDRLLGFFALAALAVFGVVTGRAFVDTRVTWVVVGGAGLFVLGWILVLVQDVGTAVKPLFRLPGFRKFREGAARSYRLLRELGTDARLLAATVLLSLVAQSVAIGAVVVLGRGLGLEIPSLLYFVIVPISLFVATVPVSIGGLGVREGAFVLLLGGAGVPTADAVALSLLYYGCFVSTGLLGGLVWLAQGVRAATLPGHRDVGNREAEGGETNATGPVHVGRSRGGTPGRMSGSPDSWSA